MTNQGVSTIGYVGAAILLVAACSDNPIVRESQPEPSLSFGINVHFVDDRMISHLRTLSMPSVRTSAYLGEWEQPHLKASRIAQINGLVAAGFEPLVVITGFTSRPVTSAVLEVVRDLPGVKFFELFNEVDAGTFTNHWRDPQPRASGRLYGAWLKQAYPVLKAERPEATFVTAGSGGTLFPVQLMPAEFVRGLYESGAQGHFDVLAIHPYGVPLLKWFVEKGEQVRQVMARFGDVEVPLWATEVGVDGSALIKKIGLPEDEPHGHWLDGQQCGMLSEILHHNRAFGLYDRIYIYALYAEAENVTAFAGAVLPPGMTPADYTHGILRADGVIPRPAYQLLKDGSCPEANN